MTSAPLALVTGASRGIGRAGAVALAKAGYHVLGVGRSERALEKLDDDIRALGASATFAPLDLKDYDAIDRLGGVIFERWGRLDAVLAAAGTIGELMPAHQFPPKMFEEAIATNLIANARLIRAMDPLLRAAKGAAVFVTSPQGQTPQAYWGASGAAKAGLENLVQAYAAEVGFTGVRVMLAEPRPTDTAIRAKAFPGEAKDHLAKPEEIAAGLIALLQSGANGARVVV
jgi:NAD(P)-dependent dehydrogenase (short-subunit alcohol dehydrogenase family)